MYYCHMTPEKDKYLCEKYPKIFRDRNASMRQTAMCWGFECGDGWFDLIDTLCSQIQYHIDWKLEGQKVAIKRGEVALEDAITEEQLQVVASQVKEKFAGLRFYIYGGDEEIRGMIKMAESMSYKICEECGNAGKVRKCGWWRTLCEQCHIEREQKKV